MFKSCGKNIQVKPNTDERILLADIKANKNLQRNIGSGSFFLFFIAQVLLVHSAEEG